MSMNVKLWNLVKEEISINQSKGAGVRGCVASTLQRQTQGFLRASFHAGPLPILSNSWHHHHHHHHHHHRLTSIYSQCWGWTGQKPPPLLPVHSHFFCDVQHPRIILHHLSPRLLWPSWWSSALHIKVQCSFQDVSLFSSVRMSKPPQSVPMQQHLQALQSTPPHHFFI